MDHTPNPLTLDLLEGNIQLLAEKERLEHDKLRLQEVDRVKSEFLARVSHDLRTPLNSIIGFSELLLGDQRHPLVPDQQDLLRAIHRNGQALQVLINDLLDLGSMQSGRLTLRCEQVSLITLLDDVRAATSPQLQAAGITVHWPDAAVLAGQIAWCDRRRIARALVNLVDNARKFTPAGGSVRTDMSCDGQRAVFAISDTGPGIAELDRERIFAAFFHRPGATRASASGVGLGLAIVRGIAELHHGTVDLDSESGKGSTFRLIIPQKMPPAEAAQEPEHG